MSTTHVKCPNCGAPIAIDDVVATLHCAYCGATSPVPQAVQNDPLWIREKRLRELNAWYQSSREELLVVDRMGNRRPPDKQCPQADIVFMACGVTGFLLTTPVLLASLLFPPLFLLAAVTMFGPPCVGMLWSHFLRTRAIERHRRFETLEAEYRRRLEELDARRPGASI